MNWLTQKMGLGPILCVCVYVTIASLNVKVDANVDADAHADVACKQSFISVEFVANKIERDLFWMNERNTVVKGNNSESKTCYCDQWTESKSGVYILVNIFSVIEHRIHLLNFIYCTVNPFCKRELVNKYSPSRYLFDLLVATILIIPIFCIIQSSPTSARSPSVGIVASQVYKDKGSFILKGLLAKAKIFFDHCRYSI